MQATWRPSDITESAPSVDDGAPKRRGRIPQTEWASILERYKGGATLSALARAYGCTPSAISYIVRKAEAGETADPEPAPTTETPVTEAPPVVAAVAPAQTEPTAPTPPQPRHTLTISSQPRPRDAIEANTMSDPTTQPQPQQPTQSAPQAPLALRPRDPQPARTDAAPGQSQGAADDAAANADIETRLTAASSACLESYRVWQRAQGSQTTQALNDAVHDLRKVLARIEIEIAVSRREDQAARPIPIPPHRAARHGV